MYCQMVSYTAVLEKVKNELEEKINKNKIIDLTKENYIEQVTEIFVINELLRFLRLEIDKNNNNEETVFSEEDYATLYLNCENISERVIGEFYESDIGTDIDGMYDMLYWVIQSCRELEEPPFISLKNLVEGTIAIIKTDKHYAEFKVLNANKHVDSSTTFCMTVWKLMENGEKSINTFIDKNYDGLDFSIFDKDKLIEFLETEFKNIRIQLL